jgi:hypothetical protein
MSPQALGLPGADRASIAARFRRLRARNRRLTAAARLTDTSGVSLNFLSFVSALAPGLGVAWILATSFELAATTG